MDITFISNVKIVGNPQFPYLIDAKTHENRKAFDSIIYFPLDFNLLFETIVYFAIIARICQL